jgi:hypothetical protein
MVANFSSALTPLVGSSSSSRRGCAVSAMAMSSSLRTPPASSRTAASCGVRQVEFAQQRSQRAAIRLSRAGFRKCRARGAGRADEHVVQHRHVQAQLRDLERAAPRRARDSRGERRVMSAPASRMLPRVGLR